MSLSLLSAVGCDSGREPTYPVFGKVVFDNNEPCQLGTIEFRSLEQMRSARGEIAKDGTFTLSTWEPNDGAVAGKHHVIVQQLIITEDLSFKSHDHGPRVMPKYGDYSTSGLEATVEAKDRNDVTIVLKLKK